MTYDYYISISMYGDYRKLENADNAIVGVFYTPASEAAFIAGASALGLSIYDRDAGHGLTGTLDQVMNEEGAR